MALSSNLHPDEEDRNASIEIVKGIISASRWNQPKEVLTPSPSQSTPNQSSVTCSKKLAQNMDMRLREGEKKFSGI